MSIEWKSETRKLKDLRDYDKNPRKMDKDRFQKLVESLKTDGYHQRLLINQDGTIIGGHARKKALLKAGYNESSDIEVLVPNILLKDEDFDRVNIRDNLSYGTFDFEILANNFDSNQLIEWGMPEDWLQIVEPEIEVTDEDNAAPELQGDAITKLGDIWKLGEHRLMCGDSTSIDAIDKLVDSNAIDMVYTDPPYGMFLDTNFTKMHKTAKGFKTGSNHHDYEKITGDNEDFSSELINTIFSCFDSCEEIFLWGADYYRSLIPSGGSWIVWDKRTNESEMNLDKVVGSSFELCWSKSAHKREIARILWSGHHGMGKGDEKSRIHPSQKPVELVLWFFKRWAKDSKNIVDLFGGSGSTLIACEKSNRKCFMMELSPYYCDVIIARWERLTKLKAELIN